MIQLTVREGGGVLSSDDKCTKTGERVIDVLAGKHPNLRYPTLGSDDNIAFEQYESCPDPVPLICNPIGMEDVAKKLGGAIYSVDAANARAYLSVYGRALAELQEEMAEWGE